MNGLAADPPFWSDDFDMDLPKIIPEAKELLGEHASLRLITTASISSKGMKSHPSVWNTHAGSTALFSTGRWIRPSFYWSDSPQVEYTLWEAVRDAWSHGYVMLIDGHIVLNTERSYNRRFYPLMSNLRGWSQLEPRRVERHKMFARAAIKVCAKKVRRILHGSGRVQL